MSLVIGIDVGGTKIAAALVDPVIGRIHARAESPTLPSRGGRAVLDDCFRLARNVAVTRPTPIGIGICEVVSPDRQITSSATIDWRDLDIAGRLSAVGPVVVESDVRAAAVAEARLGHGRGVISFLYVIAGTGLSCALVDAGIPRVGSTGSAILLGPPSLESTHSGGALMRRLETSDLRAVLDDPVRSTHVADAAYQVGHYIAVLLNALDVQLVVMGGGLGNNERYCGLVRDAAWSSLWPASHPTPFVTSALASEGGVIGAAIVAADHAPIPATEGDQ